MADFFEATKPEYQHEGPRPPVEQALQMGHDKWFKLAEQLPVAESASGAAGGHDPPVRGEAAYKLITNHEAVLRDVTNPSPTKSIMGTQLKQAELKRVNVNHAHYADQALREVARRLIGNKPGIEMIAERLDGTPDQAKAWAGTCIYLLSRVQAHRDECAGRQADMGFHAALAMRAVLSELANNAMGM